MSESSRPLSSQIDTFLEFVEKLPSKGKNTDLNKEESKSNISSNISSNNEIIDLISDSTIPFYRSKHINFILKLQETEESYVYCQTEHLRMQVLYWALCALELMSSINKLSLDQQNNILKFVISCYNSSDGGFGGNTGHDSHLLNTLSAIQIIILLNKYPKYFISNNISLKSITNYILSLQNKDGSFSGDKWGEIDTRFNYAAINALSLLNELNNKLLNKSKCIQFIGLCKNFDGGFGTKPNAESHSGMIFCCVALLNILNKLNSECNINLLNFWLCERQVSNPKNIKHLGGLNGRPEKLVDTCYSWWVLSSMAICNKIHWIDKDSLANFILRCQNKQIGGISDRPGYLADVYHTFFGICGLSLLGKGNFKKIDPTYCLPVHTLKKLGIYNRKINF